MAVYSFRSASAIVLIAMARTINLERKTVWFATVFCLGCMILSAHQHCGLSGYKA